MVVVVMTGMERKELQNGVAAAAVNKQLSTLLCAHRSVAKTPIASVAAARMTEVFMMYLSD